MSMPKTSIVEIGTAELRLIEQAAKIAGKGIEDFIRESLVCAADEVLLNQNLILTSPGKYAEFLKHLDRPPSPNERLQKTMQIATPWGKK